MNVNLTPELEALVRRKVESGLYNNQSEVVREALRLLAEQDRVREAHIAGLGAALAEGLAQGLPQGLPQGLAQADAGRLRDGATVIAELRAALASRTEPDQ